MIYTFRCKNKHEFDCVLPVSEYNSTQICECGAKGRRILTVPHLYIRPEIRYTSPIDDRPITTEKARREDMARNNCSQYDPGIKQDYHRRMEREQNNLEKKLDETVDRMIDAMPARKRELLNSELASGADATTVRGTPNVKPIIREVKNA